MQTQSSTSKLFRCPNCEHWNSCSCTNCADRRGPIMEEIIDREIGIIACGSCGFAMLIDAWFEMSCDTGLDDMAWEDARAKWWPKGKMPGAPGYRPSLMQHWRVKLWRWRGIFRNVIRLALGRGYVYRDTRLVTIADQLEKL